MDTIYNLISIQPLMKSQDPMVQLAYYKELINKQLKITKVETDFTFICLPEYAFGNKSNYSEENISLIHKELSSFAQEKNSFVIAGSYACPEEQLWFNRSIIFDNQGKNSYYYDKTHPFNYELKSGISPGRNRNFYTIDGLKVKILICADLWFPEEIRNLYKEKIDLIIVPSMAVVRNSHLVNYGKTLWQSLALTRSKENVIPLMVSDWAVQPVRGSFTCGSSCIINPSIRWKDEVEEKISFNKFEKEGDGAISSIISKTAIINYQKYRREVGLLPNLD